MGLELHGRLDGIDLVKQQRLLATRGREVALDAVEHDVQLLIVHLCGKLVKEEKLLLKQEWRVRKGPSQGTAGIHDVEVYLLAVTAPD